MLERLEPSTRGMAPSPSVMMGVYAPLEVGMAGASRLSTMTYHGSIVFSGSRVRLYSTKTFKPLGTLVYHKENCHALAFASTFRDRDSGNAADELDGDEDDMTDEEKRRRGRWLIAAGKDNRVSIWGLMSFEKGTTV